MIEVRQTAEFSHWLRRLKDAEAAARIVARLRRMEQGNPGDARSVGRGVMEMRSLTALATAFTTCIAERKL
jgi:putative addiction module killer protein